MLTTLLSVTKRVCECVRGYVRETVCEREREAERERDEEEEKK